MPHERCALRHAVKVMTKLFLLPGGLICDAVSLTEDSESRQILRMFLNTLDWGE